MQCRCVAHVVVILMTQSVVLQVEVMDEDTGKQKKYVVTTKWAATVPFGPLMDFVRCCLHFCSKHPPMSSDPLQYP